MRQIKFNKNIAKSVRQRREELKITRADMAKRLNVTAQKYVDIEAGMCQIYAYRLFNIASILNTTVGGLFKQ